MKRVRTIRGAIASAIAALALVGCGDILEVSDPQRYTTEDLDTALPAVANGVEGAVHEVIDTYVVYQALLADVYQHTGTWAGYDETDHGRFQYGTSAMDGTHNSLLRARWFAQDAEDRFKRVLGDAEAANSPLTAQVRLGGAMADLYMGMAFCESPGENDGPAVSDMDILRQAETKFTAAMQTAQSAGTTDFMHAAMAGRATARLLLGDHSGAAADAAQVPDGFSYDAVFNQQSDNWVVLVTTKQFNEAAGLMYKWWDQIDLSDAPGFMRDPWTNAPDPRIPVYFDGEVATDNETPHYSQWKYTREDSDIPMVHSDGMKLILAEAAMENGDYAGATAILNNLRAAVGLDPFDVPSDEATMMDYLLSERFAEHFMEGIRMVDLYRFGLVREVFQEIEQIAITKGGDLSDEIGERPAVGRPTKFTLTDTEATYNNNIVNDLAQRCIPRS
jgi:hypothetical protein